MNKFAKPFVMTVAILGLALSTAALDAAQQGSRWVREPIFDRLDQTTANTLANEINAGTRGGELKNASVVADTVPGFFVVWAERFYPGEETKTSKTLTGHLSATEQNKRAISLHTEQLMPGTRYVIEVQSGSGATRDGKALPGFFDAIVMVEDGQGNSLGIADDIDWPRNCNARLTITVPQSGAVRIVVSSYRNGESGPYTVIIRPE